MKTPYFRKTLFGGSVASEESADIIQMPYSDTRGILRALLLAFALGLMSLSAQTAVNVNSAVLFNSTGIFLTAGQTAVITASGTVNIASVDGPYITDPNGLIVVAPQPGTGAYSFFTNAFPSGVPPTVGGSGGEKYSFSGPYGTHTLPYGALIAGVSGTSTPSSISDFPQGFAFVGSAALFTAAASGYLFLAVNDSDNSDNVGSFSAQITAGPGAPMVCLVNQGNPTTVRAEGATELVGDMFITCTGGPPTPAGQPIPQYTVSILLNTTVTSRLVTGTFATGGVSEAILAIDDPFPSGAQVPSNATSPFGSSTAQLGCVANNSSNCAMPGTGGGFGADGPYNGSAGHYNLFQGSWNPALPQAITWTGVPIDAPGSATRTIRITNVRANANQLGVSSTLIPSSITELIIIGGSQSISPQSPQQTVGVILPGRIYSTSVSGITVQEAPGVASAFKPRNYSQYSASVAAPLASASANALQNVFGFAYNTESAFATNAPGLIGSGSGSGEIGVADTGTELAFHLNGYSNGAVVSVPNTIYLYPSGTAGVTGATGAAGASGVASLVGSGGGAGTTQLTTVNGGATATYEVLLSSPVTSEFAFLPVAAVPNPCVGFAPLSALGSADSAAPVPRFGGPATCLVMIPSSQIAATASGLVYSRVSGAFSGTVTITNVSGAAINGPFQLFFSGLSYGAVVANATSVTNGLFYITVPASSLAPGQSATVAVQLKNLAAPPTTKISFTPFIFSGSL